MPNMYSYNSSSARKYDYDYNKNTEESRQLHERKPRTSVAGAKKKNPAKSFSSFLKVVVCFAVAFAIVNGYVKINEANGEISNLDAELHNMEMRNEALRMKIEKTINPEQLQMMAVEKYGMVRPEQYQMFYVDMEQDDYAETSDDGGKTADQTSVKGVAGSMTGTLNIFN